MRVRKITAVDVCQVTGYSRNQLRGLLDELPPYNAQVTKERVARRFNAQDLIVLSVVAALELQHGMRRSAIAMISELLCSSLSGPKSVNREALITVSINPPLINFIGIEDKIREGMLVDLGAIYKKVDNYLSNEQPETHGQQLDINFGPTVVRVLDKQKAG